MASFWLLSHASRRFLKTSLSRAHSLYAVSSYHPTTTNKPNPNSNHKVTPLIPFTHRYRWTPNYHEFDLRLASHISSSSSSTTLKKDENRGSDDAKPEASWVDVYLPKQARPYAKLARLDKPIGTWLLAWPCMWSITLAASPGHLPDIKMLTLFGCGALLLRGAGCTVNDLLDQDIDTMAWCLWRFFSYPLMKRLTFWPQAYLGLTFNWGALLGWAAIKGSIDPAIVLPLYISGVFWTLVYDTVYAHQDIEDDLKVGVKSTALRFGDSTKEWITGFGILCISSLGLSGYNAEIGWPYYALLAVASGQLAWQIWTVDLSSRLDCNRKFVSNKWFGAIIFSGIVLGRLSS